MAPVGKLYEVKDGKAGFQAIADILTQRYGVEPALDRRRIRDWWMRGTLNAAGEPFPQPVETTRKDPDSGRAYRWFDVEAVDAWFKRGIPGPRRRGWKFPADRSSATL